MDEQSSTYQALLRAQSFARKPFPIGSQKIDNCPICNNAEREDDILGGDTGWALCKGCGTCYKMAWPSADELLAFYENEYRLNETGEDYPLGSHRRTAIIRTGRQFGLLGNMIGNHKRFLDYGCALGWSVHCADFLGMAAYGVEPGKMDQKFAKDMWGIELYNTLEDLPERDFDLIVMSHVLEHFIDPIGKLKELRNEYMAPEARIIIEVPTGSSVSAWNSFHAILFNAHSLAYALDQAGFEIEIMESHEINKSVAPHLLWAVGYKGGVG